jgi:putative ABC transport system permease protein
LQPLHGYGYVEQGPARDTDARLWLLTAAAVAITIGAAAVGTGLAAADGRADLSTLAAVGASPRMRRGLSVSQSGVIALLGSGLGVLAGLGTAIAVISALNQRYADMWPGPGALPIVVPWLTLGHRARRRTGGGDRRRGAAHPVPPADRAPSLAGDLTPYR